MAAVPFLTNTPWGLWASTGRTPANMRLELRLGPISIRIWSEGLRHLTPSAVAVRHFDLPLQASFSLTVTLPSCFTRIYFRVISRLVFLSCLYALCA